MSGPTRTEGAPHDRLTELAAAMLEALEALENTDTVRAVVMLDDGDRGGLALHGWDSDRDAAVALFMHLRAILEANGMQVELVTVPDSPEGLEGA